MKKVLFIFLSFILTLSLTSCNSRVSQKNSEELKTLINSLDKFEDELTFVRLDWNSSDYSHKENDKYYASYYLDDKMYNYEYDITNKKLNLNSEEIKTVEYNTIDDFTKAVFSENNIEIITINDYLPFIKYEFSKADSFMVTTTRGQNRNYYFFSTKMKDLIEFENYDNLKKGFKTELQSEEEIKISLLVNLQDKIVCPKFDISYGDSKELIAF